MGRLGNVDARARQATDLVDLGPAAANDAADHVARDADLLLTPVGVALVADDGPGEALTRREPALLALARTAAAALSPRTRAALRAVAEPATLLLLLLLALARRAAHRRTARLTRLARTELTLLLRVAVALLLLLLLGHVLALRAGAGARAAAETLGARVVQDRALAAVPVVDEALGNLLHGDADALGLARHLDDALGRLGEHLLARHHARRRELLDLADLGAALADDGADEEVRDEEADRGRRRGRGSGATLGGRGGRGRRDRVLEDGLGDERVGLSRAC